MRNNTTGVMDAGLMEGSVVDGVTKLGDYIGQHM